jgi:hypothetical protein
MLDFLVSPMNPKTRSKLLLLLKHQLLFVKESLKLKIMLLEKHTSSINDNTGAEKEKVGTVRCACNEEPGGEDYAISTT